ncbi:hypothetical protein FDG50_05455 [Clostridium botulinum]|uniref:hypothetical protein n=1 Tax=Clostridium botulinum TaxID=1491 RepID=UPI0013FFE1C3|nr:hypothetical protein [Clostridium botulinum]MBY6836898.1 hypothetical protein [Clostridium botulinum]NFG58426.1 hypothetical protein [Clostridium botulinum]NFG64862.1 hypothetical protein [Clostridium botulinum]NFQ23589.1 hypothetical protein [Clostridium botulinum]
MKKIVDMIEENSGKFGLIIIVITCFVIWMIIPKGDGKKDELIQEKISQKLYKEAYDLNHKYYDRSITKYQCTYDEINKCESMCVANLSEYRDIGKNITVENKKINYSNNKYNIILECKNNNKKINLKDIEVKVNLKHKDSPNNVISTNIKIESAMRADGGLAVVRGEINNINSKDYVYDNIQVVNCGTKIKDSEVDENIKKDQSQRDYIDDYQELINKIQLRIPEIKIQHLSGDEFGKVLSTRVNLQHNLNSTYAIVSKLPVFFETDLKNAGISEISVIIVNNDGSSNGLIIFKLSNGEYKPTLNTCK